MHEIVFSYNPYQEGLTTADAKGLMVVLKGVSFGTVLFLLCALRSLLFKAFCSEKHQFLISANHFWQGLEAEVGIEHHNPIRADIRNSQQHKPLRSFLNVFNLLTRVLWLQELFWKDLLLFSNLLQTIATLLFYWTFHWRLLSTRI